MQHRKLATALAILTASAGASALAGSAQAAVVDNFWIDLHNDTADEVSLSDGNVAFDWSNGVVSADLTGTFTVVSGDDANYRVRLDSLDGDNGVVGSTYYTPRPHGFKNDGEHDFAVDLAATAGPNVVGVEILLEKNGSGTWNERDHAYIPVLTHSDDVKILDTGIDLGGSGFDSAAHEPTSAGDVSWNIEDDGQMTASTDTYIHMERSFYPTSVRVQIRALNDNNVVLKTVNGPEHHLQTPAYDSFKDELSVTSANGTKLKVKLQEYDTFNAAWVDIAGDAQTVSVAE
jgi:hypothetical protein